MNSGHIVFHTPLLAQATNSAGDPFAVAKIALRRLFAGSTLSSPEIAPSTTPLLALAAAIGLLLILVLVVQGPAAAFRQLFDLPGHWRTFQASAARFRRSGRLIAVLCGAFVLSWTVWQARGYASSARLEEIGNLLRRKSVTETALEHGTLAALTPLRDITSLSGNLILLCAAAFVVFKSTTDRWSISRAAAQSGVATRWTTVAWVSAWAFTLYRIACHLSNPDGWPLTRLPVVEVFIAPPLVLICDALLLAWVLAELQQAESDSAGVPIDLTVQRTIRKLPRAIIACALVFPARYVAHAVWLGLSSLPPNAPPFVRQMAADILVGWGLVWVQVAGLAFLPLVGAAAWAGHKVGLVQTFIRTVRSHGARILAAVVGSGIAAAACCFFAYAALLSLPSQPWVLTAADSYAHYLTLLVGLLLAATLVEVSQQALPPIPSREHGSLSERSEPDVAFVN